MCGICGIASDNRIPEENFIRMNRTISHRGPDDNGIEAFTLPDGWSVVLGHNRLSIIDLTEMGHQPMSDTHGIVTVVFNGEIYNYEELRRTLDYYDYQSQSDTEVIIAAYKRWGKYFVKRINGMFAIALFDRSIGKLFLYRDRIGKKPLYYYIGDDGSFVFASELKPILECSFFNKQINKKIIGRYLLRSYIAAPDTIFENTYKLEPGKMLTVCKNAVEKDTYWSIENKYIESRLNQVRDYDSAKDDLEKLIRQSIKRRLISDVPVGAFLSGGYDSSLVCAIAQEECEGKLKTFSIGFFDKNYNEATYAKEVSRILGTDHTELYISEKDLIGLVDDIPTYYDEPFADSSEIPTMILSELSKRSVSVALTGDGGDELFGGYGIYNILQIVQRKQGLRPLLYLIGRNKYVRKSKAWEKRSIVYRILSDDYKKNALTQIGVNSYIDAINNMLLEPADNYYYEIERKYKEKRLDITRMLLDLEISLPDDMLTKVDRASMKYALECRCPLLDKEIVEYSFRLKPEFKNNNDITKRILKDITHKYLPRELMSRPKKGFSIPQDKWLRSVYKEKVLEWTKEDFLRKQGIFNPVTTKSFVESYLNEGDRGKWSGKNYSKIVWAYFIFQQWYQKYMTN